MSDVLDVPIVEVCGTSIGGNQVYSCLKRAEIFLSNWNPILRYSDVELGENINFKIELNQLLVPYKSKVTCSFVYKPIKSILKDPYVFCGFPGHIFSLTNGNIFNEYFEGFIIRAISHLIVDVIHSNTVNDRLSMDLFTVDSVNWDVITSYLLNITDKLVMFRKAILKNNESVYSFVLDQIKTEDGKQAWKFDEKIFTPVVIPHDVCGFDKAHIQQQCLRKLASKMPQSEINLQLKKFLNERLALTIFKMRYNVKDVSI